MSTTGKLVAVTVDCPDPSVLAAFYRDALGWDIIYQDENAAYLSDDNGPRIGFQRVDGYTAPEWPDQKAPQQMHLDIAVDDLAQAAERMTALGARVAAVQPGGDNWRVMLDPAGHPFCLTVSY